MGSPTDHAILSPSSAKRWMACTPSARFEQEFENTTSVFAEEGTLVHQIAEVMLKERLGKLPKSDWLQLVRIDERCTPEMMTHCEQYADYCMSKVSADSFVDVETRLDMTDWVPEGFGTGDFMVYTRSLRLLEFTDLKYGKGVPVSAVDNPQLKIYALGAYAWYLWVYGEDVAIDTIKMNIYQPRLGDPSEWEISLIDLLKWAEEKLKPAAELAFKGEGDYVIGDHCKFCRAKVRCTALAEYNLDLFKHELAEREMLSDADLVDIFKRGNLLVDWLNDIKEFMNSEAMKGKKFEGLKLVEGRSTRIFASEIETETKLLKAGFKAEVIYTPQELLGVTKLKTAIGAKAFKELVEPDLRKPPGKPTLVNEDDPRADYDRAVTVFRDAEIRESFALKTEE